MDSARIALLQVPLFLDCTLKPPSLIFPALPHLVHFNAGVLAAMLDPNAGAADPLRTMSTTDDDPEYWGG